MTIHWGEAEPADYIRNRARRLLENVIDYFRYVGEEIVNSEKNRVVGFRDLSLIPENGNLKAASKSGSYARRIRKGNNG